VVNFAHNARNIVEVAIEPFGSGERAIVFEFHLGCMIAMPMPPAWRRSPLGLLDMSCPPDDDSGFPMDYRHHLRTDRRNGESSQ
jgi:hypothetical protein